MLITNAPILLLPTIAIASALAPVAILTPDVVSTATLIHIPLLAATPVQSCASGVILLVQAYPSLLSATISDSGLVDTNSP